MTDITIPAAALEASAKADYERWVYHCTHVDGSRVGDASEYPTWEQLEDYQLSEALDRARAACIAMLNAWPGMLSASNGNGIFVGCSALILPLPTEASDGI